MPTPLFVAVGHHGLRMVSPDGVRWSAPQLGREGETYRQVAFGGGRCVAAGRFGGNNLFGVTGDGAAWKRLEKDARYARYVLGLTYARGAFLGLGGEPVTVGASQPFAVQSADGETWSDYRPISGRNVLRRVVWGGDRFVAVGDRGRRSVSPDGLSWQDVPDTRALDTLVDVAYGNGVFVGVGLHGLRLTSSDGATWSQRFAGEEGEHLNSVLWVGNRFVAIGLGATYTSPDGARWQRAPNQNPPLAACHGNGVFLGAAWKGRILRSTDGIRWEQVHRAEHHVEAVGFGPVGP
jgi:hypothetical protein